MAPKTELHVLKIKEGKFVTVQKIGAVLKLCAVEHQEENAPLVRIWRRERNARNQIALCFQRGKDYYFPKVDGNSLMLEMKAEDNLGNSENISDSYWFEKENVGTAEHYGLRSVIKPKRYLSIQLKRKRCIFVLSKALKECVQVQDKKIE